MRLKISDFFVKCERPFLMAVNRERDEFFFAGVGAVFENSNFRGGFFVHILLQGVQISILKCKWIELFLVPAVRYSSCRLQLALYQVANIDLWYFRDRNIAVFYKNVVMETGARWVSCDVTRFAIEQVVHIYSRYFDSRPYQGHRQRSICPRASKFVWNCPPCWSVQTMWRHFWPRENLDTKWREIQAMFHWISHSYVSIKTYSNILHDKRIQFICILSIQKTTAPGT